MNKNNEDGQEKKKSWLMIASVLSVMFTIILITVFSSAETEQEVNALLSRIEANSEQCPTGQFQYNTSIDEDGNIGILCATPNSSGGSGNASIMNYTSGTPLAKIINASVIVPYTGTVGNVSSIGAGADNLTIFTTGGNITNFAGSSSNCLGASLQMGTSISSSGVISVSCVAFPQSVVYHVAGSNAKLTANSTTMYLTKHGVTMASNYGIPLPDRNDCQKPNGLTYNIALYGLTGTFNYSIYSDGVLMQTRQITVTGNGNFEDYTAWNTIFSISASRDLEFAITKNSGTFQIANVIATIKCLV